MLLNCVSLSLRVHMRDMLFLWPLSVSSSQAVKNGSELPTFLGEQ